MKNRMSVLVCSCDSYDDLWNPFFDCLDKFWKNIPYPIYLNTEFKKYDDSRNTFNVTTLNIEGKKKKLSWSKRFAKVLDRIEEEYVLLLVDDFFLCDTVNNKYFEEIMDFMDKDKSIASFQLYGTRTRNRDVENYQTQSDLQFELISETGWKTHFVPTVWRKSILKKWLRPWESIWGFELYGSMRARRWKYPEKVYLVNSPTVFDYFLINQYSVVSNGKWLDTPEIREFFKTNEIEVDFSKRGTMTIEEYESVDMKAILKRYTWYQIIAKAFNRFRSYF